MNTETTKSPTVIRKNLGDAERFQIIKLYGDGIPCKEIAEKFNCTPKMASKIACDAANNIKTIQETRSLMSDTRVLPKKGTFITPAFLSLAETHAEMYAFFFAQTSDNKFSLIESGLDVGIMRNTRRTTKEYVYRIRGQFLRDIPMVKKIIQEESKRRADGYLVEKPTVQIELMRQIEEMKELAENDPKMRGNLLKGIELLGRSMGAFTDRVENVEVDSTSGLEKLMKKAKATIIEVEDE